MRDRIKYEIFEFLMFYYSVVKNILKRNCIQKKREMHSKRFYKEKKKKKGFRLKILQNIYNLFYTNLMSFFVRFNQV